MAFFKETGNGVRNPDKQQRPDHRSFAPPGQRETNEWGEHEPPDLEYAARQQQPEQPPIPNHLLGKLAEELTIEPLPNIKQKVAALTYGDMMELAKQIARSLPLASDDEAKNFNDRVEALLPSTLYAWATKLDQDSPPAAAGGGDRIGR